MPSLSCTNCYEIRKKLVKYSLTVYMCFALCILKACLFLSCLAQNSHLVSSQGLLIPQLLGTEFTYVSESLLITFCMVCFIMMPQLFCRSESLPTVCICTRMCFQFMTANFLMFLQLVFLWKGLLHPGFHTLCL